MSYTVEAGYTASNLELARIGIENHLADATTLESLRVSDDSDNEDADYPVVNVTKPNTYQTWRPTTFSPKIVATWTTPVNVNYLGIARHNVGSTAITGGSLYITPTGGSLEKVADFNPTDDSPILIPFDTTEIEDAEVRFGTGADVVVGVVYLGEAIVMDRPLRGSMQPVWLSRRTGVQTQISEGGEVLGSIFVRRGASVSPSWSNLSKNFYNDELKNLALDLPLNPFFFGWQPNEHPDEVVYGTLDGDVSGGQAGASTRYNFSFSMNGLA